MRRLETCCLCGTLKAGTIITGILGIILSIATIMLMYLTNIQFKTIVLDWLPQWIINIILVINLIMTMFISGALIYGAIKRRHLPMLPWVILAVMLAIGLLVSIIYSCIVYFVHEQLIEGFIVLVGGIIYLVIFIYLWFVVFSYFLNIKDEEKRGKYSKAPYRR